MGGGGEIVPENCGGLIGRIGTDPRNGWGGIQGGGRGRDGGGDTRLHDAPPLAPPRARGGWVETYIIEPKKT